MKTCEQFSGGCGIRWDRKGNVKEIYYCPLHEAASKMLALLRAFAKVTKDNDRTPVKRLSDRAIMLISQIERPIR